MLVKPDLFGRCAFFKKEEVGADGGVGLEDTIRQADYGVEVTLLQEVLFQACLDAFPEESTIGEDHSSSTAGFKKPNDKGEEKIRCLTGLKVLGKVSLNAIFRAHRRGD